MKIFKKCDSGISELHIEVLKNISFGFESATIRKAKEVMIVR